MGIKHRYAVDIQYHQINSDGQMEIYQFKNL